MLTVWGTKTHQNKDTQVSVRRNDTLDRTWLTWLQQETDTRRVREDQVYLRSRIHEREKSAHDLSLRAWLSPWSHPAEANAYITVGLLQVWISRAIQSHQIRSSSARSNFKDLINTLN